MINLLFRSSCLYFRFQMADINLLCVIIISTSVFGVFVVYYVCTEVV